MRRLLILLCVAFGAAACGASNQGASSPSTTTTAVPISASTPATTTSAHRVIHHSHPRPSHPRRRPRPKSHPAPPASGLADSTASADAVQPQPAPGSCHATGRAPYELPDRHCTPGALNPAVTQATINHTICVPGYTETIRPSESITEPEKLASMAAYGAGRRSPHDFEYDHLVSLELGGAANDPRNLWPEPGASPNPKDSVEDQLHRLVCDGEMSLARAQHVIATGWVSYARAHGAGGTSAPAPSSPQSATPPAPAPSSSNRGPSPSPPSAASGPNQPISEVNCSDFSTHAAAQQWFAAHGGSPSNDVAGLDGDHDGVACESLPWWQPPRQT